MHKIDSILNKDDLENALNEVKHPKLYVFDIKNFESLNLRFGDDAGNFILDALANSLKQYSIENKMQAFYIQNDEFALLQDKPFDLNSMEKLLFSLLAFAETKSYKYDLLDVELDIELTLGICIDKYKLLDKAYKALNLAKAHERPFVTYSEYVNKEWNETEKLWTDIVEKAINEKRLLPYYQAIFDIDGNVKHFEAFGRILIENETKSPHSFLNMAKSQNLTTSLTHAMFNILKNLNFSKPCTLNFGTEDIKNKEILKKLNENDSLIYEIPLNYTTNEIARTVDFIDELQINPKRVILDNVANVGIFNEENINIKKIGIIKISGNLIKNLHLDKIAVKRVEKIVNFAKENGVKTIATQINSKATLDEAKKLNIDYFQGYYLQIPSNKPSIEKRNTLN